MSHLSRLLGRGFTLIELLIVVAIIAILAAIAVPNFLEAQTRAKVSRAMSDLRTMASGIEIYFVDINKYPPYGRLYYEDNMTTKPIRMQFPATENNKADLMQFVGPQLTTPTAYITGFFEDPFMTHDERHPLLKHYEYLNMDQHFANFSSFALKNFDWTHQLIPAWGHWRMVAAGPDRDRGEDIKDNLVYDPTNGTVSNGDIVRCERTVQNKINLRAP